MPPESTPTTENQKPSAIHLTPLTRFFTLEEWIPYMTEDVKEYVDRQQLTIEEFEEWRNDSWYKIFQEFDNGYIENFQEYIDYPEMIDEVIEKHSGGCIRRQEFISWIHKQIASLQKIEEEQQTTAIWQNPIKKDTVHPIPLSDNLYKFIKIWHNEYGENPGEYNHAVLLSTQLGLNLGILGSYKLIIYQSDQMEQTVQLTETAIVSMEAKDKDPIFIRHIKGLA